MKRIALTATALATVMFGMSGCIFFHDHSEPINAGYGNSLNHNAAVAIVDPAPANATAGAPDFNGKRAAIAMENYETGQIEQVEAESTQDFGDN